MDCDPDHPKSDIASLSLFLATPAQAIESRRRTHKIWGNGMTEEQYIERDDQCAESLCGRDGKFRVWWVWSNSHELEGRCNSQGFWLRGMILIHLSSSPLVKLFLRAGVVHRLNSSASQQVACYGIASVFTPPTYRKRGYAQHMMSLLHWVLSPESLSTFPQEWGTPPPRIPELPNGQFSVLYSDIGNFYARCGSKLDEDGWIMRGANSVVWDASTLTPATFSPKSSAKWKWLSENDVDGVILRDSELIQSELRVKPSAKVSFTFLPSGGVEAFQRERQKIFWEKENPPMDRWGAVLDTTDASTVFATWTFELIPSKPRTLVVTRIRVDPGDEAQVHDLLRQAFEVAKEHKIAKMEVWDASEEIKGVLEQAGGQSIKRDEHLPAFKWYGIERSDDIEWVLNEK
ncbi:hypothetical protein D9758_007887 [Tetrapyrgos nigripes]|uniref:LYC1 C-terminal domain-containing protein n=1 Tax=Tetrapyrgos nigripes TaxID=182062 RepID=A0A8H5D3F2_9AGAR|nr:hypothetical protein D9758_007887 [Tetrapyrgos nigripes]